MIIREMRAELGDTQSEFAARYDIPFRTIQNWETGVRKPPEYIIELLSGFGRILNRRTLKLLKHSKKNLPKRRDFIGAVAWLKAGSHVVRCGVCVGFSPMCQGIFGVAAAVCRRVYRTMRYRLQRCGCSWQLD